MKTFKMYGLVSTCLYYEIKADSEKDAINAFYNLADRDYPCSDDISLDDIVVEDNENESTND